MRVLVFIVFLIIVGCGRVDSPNDGEIVLARVDDKKLTLDDARRIDRSGILGAQNVHVLVDHWTERQLLMKIAEEEGLESDTVVRLKLEEARANILTGALGNHYVMKYGSETAARRELRMRLNEVRASSRIEQQPWKVK